jgi:hypothetical protein
MIHYIYTWIKKLFYGPSVEPKIWIKDVKQDDNTFIFIKAQKPIERQYDDYRTNKFLQEIKTFSFKNKNKKNTSIISDNH